MMDDDDEWIKWAQNLNTSFYTIWVKHAFNLINFSNLQKNMNFNVKD